MRRKSLFALIGAAVLAVLVLLLIVAEASAPEATIVSVPTALWYLLTTLTTVGYGDCFPVTAAGRIIGAVFQLMSLGLLSLLIGMLVTALRGRTLPRLRLRRLQKRQWFVFSEKNEASLALAKALAREDPDRALLFAGAEGEAGPGLALPMDAEDLCGRKKDGSFRLFCLGAEDAENERLAARFADGPCRVYCRSSHLPDRLPDNQLRFDPAVLCARLYWDSFPLQSACERILLVGDGPWAEALLEQGLLRNVLDPGQHVQYTLAGDAPGFLSGLPRLEQMLEVDPAAGGRDSIRCIGAWNADAALIETADRIVFCWPDEARSRRELAQLLRCFPVRGAVHARLSVPYEGAACFGALEEIYTPALVMGEALDRRAKTLHDRYRGANPDAPAWQALSDFTRRSNLAAADHLSVKLRLLGEQTASPEACARALERFRQADAADRERYRRIEHARWMRFHLLNGWRYGPVRNDALRQHPLLVPFDRLEPEQQAKDDYGWELLDSLAGQPSEPGGAS